MADPTQPGSKIFDPDLSLVWCDMFHLVNKISKKICIWVIFSLKELLAAKAQVPHLWMHQNEPNLDKDHVNQKVCITFKSVIILVNA